MNQECWLFLMPILTFAAGVAAGAYIQRASDRMLARRGK